MPTIDINAIRQALLRRAGLPGIGQGPQQPILNQTGAPTQPTPTGAPGSQTTGTPQISNPPTPQPRFSSPFARPKGQGANFDDETKKISKLLITKLLQIM